MRLLDTWPGFATSDLNYVPGQIVANACTVELGPDGAFTIGAATGFHFITAYVAANATWLGIVKRKRKQRPALSELLGLTM